MVKLDLVTRKAPVMWIGPCGMGDGVWTGEGPGFLDFDGVLLWRVTSFLDVLELVVLEESFLPFGEILAALVGGPFLFPLTGVVDTGVFSGAGAGSFSLCSFSLCFTSFGGAANQKQDPTI